MSEIIVILLCHCFTFTGHGSLIYVNLSPVHVKWVTRSYPLYIPEWITLYKAHSYSLYHVKLLYSYIHMLSQCFWGLKIVAVVFFLGLLILDRLE